MTSLVDLADLDVALVRADNPSPMTLTGTNTWVVGHSPAWVVDPGPALPSHLSAVAEAVAARGGAGGILLTHDHADHAEAVPALRERLGGSGAVPLAAARGGADVELRDGLEVGPFTVWEHPGHADDHVVARFGGAAFTGDAVLGTGSVFVAGRLREHLDGLRRLRAVDGLRVLCPGHGDPVWEPVAKLDEYLSHRAAREGALVAALDAGARSEDELLDAAWADAPAELRPAAARSLAAHLGKLREEGRLPPGVA